MRKKIQNPHTIQGCIDEQIFCRIKYDLAASSSKILEIISQVTPSFVLLLFKNVGIKFCVFV